MSQQKCVFMCIGLCCVSKSINTNPAVASVCFHMSQPSRFGFGWQRNLICQAILLHPRYTILSILLLIYSLLQAPPLSQTSAYLLSSIHPFTSRKLLQGACHLPVSKGNEKGGREQGCHHLQTENITGKPELRGIVHLQLLVPIDFHEVNGDQQLKVNYPFKSKNVRLYSLWDLSNMFVP